jgi:hypothetical protein
MDAPSAAPATGNVIGAEAAGPATRPPEPNEPSAQDLLEMVRNLHAQQHLTHLKQLDADEQKWRDTHQEQWQQQWQQLWQQLQTDWELRRLGFDHAQRRHDLIAARLLNVFEDLKLLPRRVSVAPDSGGAPRRQRCRSEPWLPERVAAPRPADGVRGGVDGGWKLLRVDGGWKRRLFRVWPRQPATRWRHGRDAPQRGCHQRRAFGT